MTAAGDTPGGLYKTTVVIWSACPGNRVQLSTLAREADTGAAYCSSDRTVFVADPAADPDWDGTEFFGEVGPGGVLLLCDGCYQAATGQLAECEDGCPQDLGHTGLCLRASTGQCQWCGAEDRLRQVRRDNVDLPTAGEENEGQWFLHWPGGRQGPYPSERAAWDAWHSSGEPGPPDWPAADLAPRSPARTGRAPRNAPELGTERGGAYLRVAGPHQGMSVPTLTCADKGDCHCRPVRYVLPGRAAHPAPATAKGTIVMTTTTTAGPEVIRVGTPEALLDAIPLLVGFEPADSLVVLGCQPPRDRVSVTLRYDIDLQGQPAADIAAHAVALFASQGVGILVAVGYGPADAVDPFIAALAGAAASAGLILARALRAENGRYHSYGEDGPADGIAFTAARHEGVLARRADLEAQLSPIGGAAAARIARAVAHAEAAGVGREAGLAVAAGTIARYRDGGHLAVRDETGQLLVALRSLRIRDDSWARMDPVHKAEHLRLWTDLTRHAPAGYVAAPASLLAFVAWQHGNGALANVALDRALADNTQYSMAQVLRQLITAGSPPSLAVLPMTPEEVAASYDEDDRADGPI